MSNRKARKARKAEEARLKQIEIEKENHECYGCEWGTLEGNTRYCMFNRCIRV